uniref:Uncharacterized protein n=1 Tax=Kalanchoe fedtschenkoi TaxID=63787 RepID=A0A7N0TZP8_KALFE
MLSFFDFTFVSSSSSAAASTVILRVFSDGPGGNISVLRPSSFRRMQPRMSSARSLRSFRISISVDGSIVQLSMKAPIDAIWVSHQGRNGRWRDLR